MQGRTALCHHIFPPLSPYSIGVITMKRQLIYGCAGLAVLLAAVMMSAQVRGEVLAAGERCLTVLIPSLYFFSFLAAFCIRSGGLRAISNLFGREGILLTSLVFAQLGGYPVGAQLLHELRLTGVISARQERDLLCVCMGCGPGFLLGTVCREVSQGMALWLMLSVSLPNLVLYAFVRSKTEQETPQPVRIPLAQSITAAAESAASAMLKITAMVMAFAGVMGILTGFGLLECLAERGKHLCRTVLEVSCVTDVLQTGGGLPLSAALLSFGGLCVHMQAAAICEGNVNWGKLWLFRAAAAVMAYGLCKIGVTWVFRETQPVILMEPHAVLTTGSILPGACLLMMSAMLLRKSTRKS